MPYTTRSFSATPGNLRRLAAANVLGWLILCGLSSAALAEDAPPAAPTGTKEYFTQQPAGTALVIRMDAFETEFESRVFDPKDVLLRASGLPAQRLGAVYQFIEAPSKTRNLRIEVTLGHGTDRSKLDMQVIRFEPGGPDKSMLMKAYRLLSAGLDLEPSTRPEAWTIKVIALTQAAYVFDQLGMQEMQLWSEYYAYHIALTILNDPLTAAEGAQKIYAAATRSRLNELALAALQMEGSATVAQVHSKNMPTAKALFQRAQDLFQQTAELAGKMDFQHERARAIYHSGLAFEEAADTGKAFAQFDQAVGVASSCGDTALANQIRQHAAELHESLGDNAEAIALMRQISAEVPVQSAAAEPEQKEADAGQEGDRANQEMVTYLVEQGRLLEKTYRHAQAAEVLRQALELNQKSASPTLSGPVILLLAKALYGAGRMDEALQYLQEATKKTPSFGHEGVLYEAYGILASIKRGRGDFAAMSAARKHQEMFSTTPGAHAALLFESGLDDLASSGIGSASARSLLRQSEKEAQESGAKTIQQLALLQLCAVGELVPGAGSSCTGEAAQAAKADLEATGLPVPRLQARLLWSQILRRDGQLSRAQDELDQLIGEMRFFRSYLPGVLGAWYWQNHDFVFNSFMESMLEQLGPRVGSDRGNAAAMRSLAAIDRLTRYAREQAQPAAAAVPPSARPELERLRSLIAAREAAKSQKDAAPLARDILQNLRQSLNQMANAEESSASLGRGLNRLADNEALLTYYFTANRVYAWIGRNNGLELVQIPWSENQSEELTRVTDGLRLGSVKSGPPTEFAAMMDHLGQTLLAPVARLLPETIYFFPSGRMEGFPLDALRWDGSFLASRHTVINLLSLDGPESHSPRVEHDDLQHFFLAGNQQQSAGDFGLLKPPSAELKEIADLFVGPGLHIVQGAALQWDEFQDKRFTQAGLIHLAVPGIIDLRNPEKSRLLLSGNTTDPGHEFLLPQDIAAKKLKAALVVLSSIDFSGTNPSAFDHNTRFIGEFLNSGAGAVVASLWKAGDTHAAQFMRRFYQQLKTMPDVSQALSATKRSYLAENEMGGDGTWAAFQLFID